MMQIVLVGLGAGAAAALLFASVATGSILATLLFYLAPLPLMIAALGWSHWAGLLAGVMAAASLGIGLGAYFFVAFLLGVALPAWWLAYLAMLARPVATDGATHLEWYPVGRLLFWAAIIGAVVVIAAIPNFGTDKESFQAGLRSAFERAIRFQEQTPAGASDAPLRADFESLITILVLAVPPAAAVLATLISSLNLWLAGRIAKISGRLTRPWPDLTAIRLPTFAGSLLAIAVAGSFLPDLAGVAAGVMAASLLMAFALVGFAVLHVVTRNVGNRSLMLGGIYAAVVIFSWPVLAIALLGVADAAFQIRARATTGRGPPPRSLT